MSEVTERGQNGQFLPGQSGNPAGRPLGTRNKTTMVKEFIENALTNELQEDAIEILQQAILKAKQGDNAMIKFLLGDLLSEVRREVTGANGSGPITVTVNNMTDKPATVTIDHEEDNEQEE